MTAPYPHVTSGREGGGCTWILPRCLWEVGGLHGLGDLSLRACVFLRVGGKCFLTLNEMLRCVCG